MAFPNVKLARRPLHFIYLCDCSGSMRGQKMQSLNQAIRQTLPAMAEVASDNPEAQLLVRAVRFSDRAEWHIAQPTPVEELQHAWQDLEAYGLTSMGEAMTLVAEVLRTPPMEQRALPPVLVLISDGAPTDDYYAGLQKLLMSLGLERLFDSRSPSGMTLPLMSFRNLLDQKVTLPKQMMDRLCVHFRRMTPALWLATSNGLQLRL